LEASEHGHITFVRLLLENGVDIEAASRLEGSETITALQLACQNGRLAIALLLIANGAKVKHSSADPRHPVFVVAKGAHADVLLMLPRHIDDINIADGAGRTPLSYAITHGFYKLARALIEAGADVHRADNEGKTALWRAVLIADGAIVRLLIEKGADVNVRPSSGQSALSLAKTFGQLAIQELLVQNGAVG
jgi:ankyrin repeat protein